MATLYFRSDTATVNGLSAYKLLDTNTAVDTDACYLGGYYSGGGVYEHSQIAKRSAGGTETVIGAWGSGQMMFPNGSPGIETTTTWSCPATSLAETDSLIVRNALSESSAGTDVSIAHSTAANPGSLLAAIWTFVRTPFADADATGCAWQRFGGTNGGNGQSRITGIGFGPAEGGGSVYPIWRSIGAGIGIGIN